jgi:hypothetical protein
VTPAGVVSTVASGFTSPFYLAFDAAGNLYVSNANGTTVSKVTTSVSVPFTLGGSAIAGTDYSGVTTSPLVIPAGQTTGIITGTLIDDGAPDAGKTLTFTLGTPTGAGLGSLSVNTLTIAEPAPIVAPVYFTETNVAEQIGVLTGSPQQASVNTTFAAPFVAQVTANGAPVAGVPVTFTVVNGATNSQGNYPSGSFDPSGTFPGGTTFTIYTDSSGDATSPYVTANGFGGTWTVTATTPNATNNPATFDLFNNAPVAPPSMNPVTGSTPQSANIDTPYATNLGVVITDGNGQPINGQTVTFTAPGGGASGTFVGGGTTATAVTGSNPNLPGVATVPAFTANNTIGNFFVTANGDGLSTSFNLYNGVAPPKYIYKVLGDNQSTPINQAYQSQLEVKVTDVNGNLLNNVPVAFVAPSGGASGTFNGQTTVTVNTMGGYAMTPFTANSLTGTFYVSATVTGLTPVYFTEKNIDLPSAINFVGKANTATMVGTAFASPYPHVQVTDAANKGVQGAMVTFAIQLAGNGAGPTVTASITVTTDANGMAPATGGPGLAFTADTIAGSWQIVASVSGVATPQSLTMTNLPGPFAKLVPLSGSGQQTAVTTAFGAPLVAETEDKYGNPVNGVAVTFVAPSPFQNNPPSATLSATTAKTTTTTVKVTSATINGQAGEVVVYPTANTVAGGPYNVTESAPLPGGGTATASPPPALTNLPGAPAKVGPAPAPTNNGNNQLVGFGATFHPLVVQVTDKYGNPVPGDIVTFTVHPSSLGGDGTFAGGKLTADGLQPTNAAGLAEAPTLVANRKSGVFTVSPGVSGATGVTATNFSLRVDPIITAESPPQSATVHRTYARALYAKVEDIHGNPIAGAAVTFTAPTSGPSGTFGGKSSVTVLSNAHGIATAPPFAANTQAGSFLVTIVVQGGTAPASISLTNLAGPAARLSIVSGNAQTAAVNSAFGVPLAVRVTDAFGNAVSAVRVTFDVQPNKTTGAAAFFNGKTKATVTTDNTGLATAPVLQAKGKRGGFSVTAALAGESSQAILRLSIE